jgi:hypothetical protein
MPRPTDVTLGAPADFSPTASPTTQLNVVAPLNVTAKPTQGEALAKALGLAQETIQPALRKDQIMQGKGDSDQGELDQLLGQTDPGKMQAVSGYRQGAQRVSVEASGLQAVQKIETLAKTDWANDSIQNTTDENGNVVPGMLAKANAVLQQDLGGLEKDPNAARVLLPMVESTLKKISGDRVNENIENTIQQGIDNSTALAVRQAQANDGSWNFQQQLDKLTQVYATRGGRPAAQEALFRSIATAMVQSHDPTLDKKLNIPDKVTFTDSNGLTQTIDGPLYSPKNYATLETAREKALELQTKDNHAAVMQTETGITSGILQNKEPTQALIQYLQMPGANPAFAVSMMNFYKERDKQGADDEVNSPAFANIQRDVLVGNITTANQVAKAVDDAHLTGKARVQAYQKALDGLRTTQTTNQDDPAVRGGVAYLDQMYRPGADPITGKFNNPAAVSQHAGVLTAYRTEVEQLIKQGKSAEDASNTALGDVQKAWKEPVEQPKNSAAHAAKDDLGRVNMIRNAAKDPAAFNAAGITAQDVVRYRDAGYYTQAEGVAAMNLIIARHNK